MVEWGTVPLPDDPDLSPGQLEGLLARSHAGEPKEFRVSVDVLVNLAVTAGGVAVLMLATFVYAMRTRVHATMDTVLPLGSLPVQVAMYERAPLGGVTWLGVAVWAVRFGFETVGDAQLRRFRADPANAGRVLDRGPWRYEGPAAAV